MKACNICKISKPLTDFYKHNKTKDKRQSKCKDCEKAIRKRVRQENPGHYYKLNPEYYKNYLKKWGQDNRENIQEIQKRHYNKKLKLDPIYRLRASVGSRMRECLKSQNKKKLGSAVDYLGCNYQHLKHHIESKFTDGMCWDNYGDWEIDHIHPISKGGSFHYTNLQPLWWQDNRRKSDSMLD